MLLIHLQPEYIGNVFGFRVTNTFITSVLVTSLLTVVAVGSSFHTAGKRNILSEALRVGVWELLLFIDSITGNRSFSKRIFPLIATFFIFIGTANVIALIPGFLGAFYVHTSEGTVPLLRSPNSDLTTTLALALYSVAVMQLFSISVLGPGGYISRFISFVSPIRFVMGFFELLSEAVKVLSFSFRLFGNIFAGEVLLAVMAFLMPFIVPLPFYFMELFVGFIQAFVFAVLSDAFFTVALAEE